MDTFCNIVKETNYTAEKLVSLDLSRVSKASSYFHDFVLRRLNFTCLRNAVFKNNVSVTNVTLSILGKVCPNLQLLDLNGCSAINDVGIQNLVFPASILKSGEVNLVAGNARRIKTNPLSRTLRVSTLLESRQNCHLLLSRFSIYWKHL